MNSTKFKVQFCDTIWFMRREGTPKPSCLPILAELRSKVYDSHVDKLCLMCVLWAGSLALDSCNVASEEFTALIGTFCKNQVIRSGFTGISCVNPYMEQKLAWKQSLLVRIQIVRSFFFHDKILNENTACSWLLNSIFFLSCNCSIASVCFFCSTTIMASAFDY